MTADYDQQLEGMLAGTVRVITWDLHPVDEDVVLPRLLLPVGVGWLSNICSEDLVGVGVDWRFLVPPARPTTDRPIWVRVDIAIPSRDPVKIAWPIATGADIDCLSMISMADSIGLMFDGRDGQDLAYAHLAVIVRGIGLRDLTEYQGLIHRVVDPRVKRALEAYLRAQPDRRSQS